MSNVKNKNKMNNGVAAIWAKKPSFTPKPPAFPSVPGLLRCPHGASYCLRSECDSLASSM